MTVSREFPITHPRAGEPTGFVRKILHTINSGETLKAHTLRSNYQLWEQRAQQINSGNACLSLRYWSGKPYRSPQVEFGTLFKIGIQKLENPQNFVFASINGQKIDWGTVAENDGLGFNDFLDWFKVRTPEPMAIIHFTSFRY